MRATKCASSLVFALVVTAGCGGAAESAGGVVTANSSASPMLGAADRARKWADCMRSEGVPVTQNEEDQFVVDKERTPLQKVEAATARCRELAPVGDLDAKRPTAEELAKLRQYAACMRDNGIPAYPDPDPATGLASGEDALADRDKYDPALRAAMDTCQPLIGGGSGTVGG
ncbi:MAG TPA: hypothetical protein VES42_23910 [Pilimelia sp.]|nr:hypothetical protein [Pilimelia sp.]